MRMNGKMPNNMTRARNAMPGQGRAGGAFGRTGQSDRGVCAAVPIAFLLCCTTTATPTRSVVGKTFSLKNKPKIIREQRTE